MTDKRAHYGVLGALLLVALTGCSSAVDAVCQVQGTATGGYVVRFNRVGAASSPACDVFGSTPASFSDVWIIEQYGKATDGALAMTSAAPAMAPPDDSEPNSSVYSKGKFSAVYPDSNQLCTVPTMTDMTALAANGGATALQYSALTMQFLSTAFYTGTQFKGTVTVTRNGCTANYTTQGLSPTVPCSENADCDPFKKPVSSGIQSNYNQGCYIAYSLDETDPDNPVKVRNGPEQWAAEAADYGFIDDGTNLGVCFFNAEFPSLGQFTNPHP